MELTEEISAQQAEIIKMIAIPVFMLDVDYCKELVKQMYNQASRQESISILNPSYPQEKNDLIRKKAEALSHLVRYVEALKEVDAINKKLSQTEHIRSEIAQMFL